MASAGPAPSGKRPMDVDINLVPFIDLMSCCICFLLISAVWTQITKIDVKPAPNLPSETPPKDEEKVNLSVHVKAVGYSISDGTNTVDLPIHGTDYPVKDLEEKLKGLRDAYPDITMVTVKSDDAVEYKNLIQVMDHCLKFGLADIVISGAT